MNYIEKEQRPWGRYFVMEESEKHKVKRIEVLAGHRLSYQYHKHRSEVWVIVKGKALITLDGSSKYYDVGETAIIPQGTKHRIANDSNEDVVFIEVQTGEYFGEDDIVRLEDDYLRA